MPRTLWSGSLSFGLVNVPVAMVTAVRDLDLHFRQLHESDGAPIEVQRWCSKEDVEIPYEEIVRAFELEDGGQVIVTDEELVAVEPRRTRTIEIEQFVEVTEVDPIYFDHPYYLLPTGSDDGSARAYRLLVEVMARTDRAALGRFVLRAKEYLAIVRAHEGALMLSTMLFADEVRETKDIEAATQKAHKPPAQQLARRGLGDRGAVRGLGAGEVEGPLPPAPAGRRRPQAQGSDDQGARAAGARARAAPRPDGCA